MGSIRSSSLLSAAVAGTALLLMLLAFGRTVLPSRSAHAAAQETVRLASGSTISLATPRFLVAGKRYAFTWAGGGPPQTHTLKRVLPDGWVEVEVAEENVDPSLLIPGTLPTRWLNAALALSIQEMRPLP